MIGRGGTKQRTITENSAGIMSVQSKNTVDAALAGSLKELAAEHPIEKITIKEITDGAGVIRPTFYNHFQDKYELLEWIIKTELIEPIRPLLIHGMTEAAMVLIFTNIRKDKVFYSKVVRLDVPVSFTMIATRCVKGVLKEIIEERSQGKQPRHQWLTSDVVSDYFAQSMTFACIGWIKDGMTISPEEMAEAYQYMITRSLEDVINGN